MIRKVPLLTSQYQFYCRENLSLSFPERAFPRQVVFIFCYRGKLLPFPGKKVFLCEE